MPVNVSIIVPIHNEAENIPALLDRLDTVSGSLQSLHDIRTSYIFIDDGSTDDSFAILKDWKYGGRTVSLLQFSRNFGKEAALTAGIAGALDCDAAILMDADLQHPPEMIIDFVRIWKEQKVDSVYAYKANRRETEGFARSLLSAIFFKVINYGARYRVEPDAGDFRLISQRFMKVLASLDESERFMKGLYNWVGFRQVGLPLIVPPRTGGATKFRFLHLAAMTLDAITSFTTAPLRIMAICGALIAASSLLYGFYILVEHFFLSRSVISGIASALMLISLFSGVQLFFLGLIGEYIGKAVAEAKRRPAYILAENIRIDAPDDRNR